MSLADSRAWRPAGRIAAVSMFAEMTRDEKSWALGEVHLRQVSLCRCLVVAGGVDARLLRMWPCWLNFEDL